MIWCWSRSCWGHEICSRSTGEVEGCPWAIPGSLCYSRSNHCFSLSARRQRSGPWRHNTGAFFPVLWFCKGWLSPMHQQCGFICLGCCSWCPSWADYWSFCNSCVFKTVGGGQSRAYWSIRPNLGIDECASCCASSSLDILCNELVVSCNIYLFLWIWSGFALLLNLSLSDMSRLWPIFPCGFFVLCHSLFLLGDVVELKELIIFFLG